MRNPAALKADQAAQWTSGATRRLERAELIEKHWRAISDGLLARAGVVAGQHVLDVGTGHGEPALEVARLVGSDGHVTGVDLSPEMLEAAGIRAAAQGIENVAWLTRDAEDLGLAGAGFDVAIARNSLMFLPRPDLAMAGVFEALRPGGSFVIAVVGPEETQAQWTMTVDALIGSLGIEPLRPGKVGEPGVYSVSSPVVLRELFEQAGYQDVRIDCEDIVYDFDDPEEVVTWHEINPTIQGLLGGRSRAETTAAWEAVMTAARSRADADGHIRIPSQIIYAAGCRPS